ncbi:hypothetical protein D3C75_388000 [compost metagenome]
MRRWNNLTYQSKLMLAFFLLGIIPSMVIGTMAYFKSVGTLEARVNEDLGVIAGQLNEAIQRFSQCGQADHGQGAGLESAGVPG